MTDHTEVPALGPAARIVAREPLERHPLVNTLHGVFTPVRKYLHTRRLLQTNHPLYQYTPAQLHASGAMGPWTFNLTESMLASVPTLMLIKIMTFFWPLPPVEDPNVPELAKRVGEYAASIGSTLQPLYVPLLLTLLATLCARGSLHRKDLTSERVALARYAYLYIDGSRGLVPQSVLGLVIALALWISQRDAWTLPVGIALGLLAFYAWVHLSYIAFYLQPRLLFAINGYSTRAVHFWTAKRNRPANVAPWRRYKLVVFFGGGILIWLLVIALNLLTFAIAYGLAAISLRA